MLISKFAKLLLGSAALALFFCFIGLALQVFGVISMLLGRVFLILAWIVAVVGVAVSDFACQKSRKFVVTTTLLTAMTLGGLLFYLDRWAEATRALPEARASVQQPSIASPQPKPVPPLATPQKSETQEPKKTLPKSHPKTETPTPSTSGNNSPSVGGINQGPGSALSFNQQGGVTAGTINIGTQWPFNAEIQQAMIVSLSQTTGRVRLGWPSMDPDGLKFAGGLLYTFEKAGWKEEPQNVQGSYVGSICYPSETWDCHGIRLQFKDPSSTMAQTVVAAFRKISVHLEVSQDNSLDDDLVDVLVSKP